ncbi:MAG: c-type cytochrome [Sphingobacteriales bacterium]|nr:MAG: c-type cytochrome [Sphingobacteriales bacterium]
MNSIYKKLLACSGLLFMIPAVSFALSVVPPAETPATGAYDTIRYVLFGFALLLLFVIIALGAAIKASLQIKSKQFAKRNQAPKVLGLLFLGLGLIATQPVFAEDAIVKEVVEEAPGFWANLFNTAPNDMLITILVILVELTVIFVLVRVQIKLLQEKAVEVPKTASVSFSWARFLEKLGANKATDDITSLDLNHEYDGIRELDNNIPKWWQLSFAGTVVIGIIYIFRMFVTGSLPDQISELQEDQRVAAIKIAEYLKNSANNVDENSVIMLDAGGIAQGKELFAKNCVACHGGSGEGTIGPNLTDEYWLHKGGIKDVFYSIKYGWPEKGMKSWQSDFSPAQIAQLASYVKSLAGTNPPNAKEKDGELHKDDSEVVAPEAKTAEATPAAAPQDNNDKAS